MHLVHCRRRPPLLLGIAVPLLLWAGAGTAQAPVQADGVRSAPAQARQAPAQDDPPPEHDEGKNQGRGTAPAMGSPGAPAVQGDDALPAAAAGGVFAVSLGTAAFLLGWGRRGKGGKGSDGSRVQEA